MTRTDELPNDIEALKQMIVALQQQSEAEVARLKAEQQVAIDAAVNAAVDEAVQAAVAAILRRYYGPRSEKFDPRQLLLFGQGVDQAPLDAASIAEEAGEELTTRRIKNRIKNRNKHGRQQLPEHLERIEIEHDLDNKACPACGNERCRIGAEVSEQLEYFPASFKVLKHIRPKYACTKCDHDGYNHRQGARRSELAGLRHHQQVGRSPATVPAGTDLRAPAGAHCPQYDVCLDAVLR